MSAILSSIFCSSKCTIFFPKTTSERLGGRWVVHIAQIEKNLKKPLDFPGKRRYNKGTKNEGRTKK